MSMQLGHPSSRSDISAYALDSRENGGGAPPGIGDQGRNYENNGKNTPAGSKNEACDVGSTELIKQKVNEGEYP